jgi:hypothetical protein
MTICAATADVRLGTAAGGGLFASRLKNNLLSSAEIGFVSFWCVMQAIKLKETRT